MKFLERYFNIHRTWEQFYRDESSFQIRPLPLNLKDFSRMFPYHICFNKQMVVEHVGECAYVHSEVVFYEIAFR